MDDAESHTITRLLQLAGKGDERARSDLYDALYRQLSGLACSKLRMRPPGHSLQPASLVSEVYMKLVGKEGRFGDRGHFLATAAKAMKQVLDDHAKHKLRQKRGGDSTILPLSEMTIPFYDQNVEALELRLALCRLRELDPRDADVFELRFYGGLTCQEVADELKLKLRTVEREWRAARAWLRSELK